MSLSSPSLFYLLFLPHYFLNPLLYLFPHILSIYILLLHLLFPHLLLSFLLILPLLSLYSGHDLLPHHLLVLHLWLSCLLTDLFVPPTLPIPLHSDSQAAIYIAKNPVFHDQTKHVELGCHFVRRQFQCGLISLFFFFPLVLS